MILHFAKTALLWLLVAVAIASASVFVGACAGLMFRGCNYVLTEGWK